MGTGDTFETGPRVGFYGDRNSFRPGPVWFTIGGDANPAEPGVNVERRTSTGYTNSIATLCDRDGNGRWNGSLTATSFIQTSSREAKEEIAPFLTAGKTLLFAHGFAIRFGTIRPPSGVDVIMVAPKAPGHRVREVYAAGGGVPGLVAVAQDASGRGMATALAYAKGIGCTRAGVLRTTFDEETETDLFGEQAVLCGGVSALVKAGFETLVEAGYQPEVAYFECLHELKLIVDLVQQGGLSYMRYSVSDTAEWGDYVAGPRIVTDETRAAMRALLAEVRSGAFAERWIAENRTGRAEFERRRAADVDHPIERVGRALRRRMPFIDPKEIVPGGAAPRAAALAT